LPGSARAAAGSGTIVRTSGDTLGATLPAHEYTKCVSKKSVFFSKIKIWYFACFSAQNQQF
jgi:hypothetical protein